MLFLWLPFYLFVCLLSISLSPHLKFFAPTDSFCSCLRSAVFKILDLPVLAQRTNTPPPTGWTIGRTLTLKLCYSNSNSKSFSGSPHKRLPVVWLKIHHKFNMNWLRSIKIYHTTIKKNYFWFSAVSCIFVKCSFQFFILLNKNIPIKIKDMHTKRHHTYRTHWDKLIINGGKWGFILFSPKYSINKILFVWRIVWNQIELE